MTPEQSLALLLLDLLGLLAAAALFIGAIVAGGVLFLGEWRR